MADNYLDEYYDQPMLAGKKGKKAKNPPLYSKKHIRNYQDKVEKNLANKKTKS